VRVRGHATPDGTAWRIGIRERWVGPDLGVADAYATAALAMGAPGPDWLARLPGHESAVITADGQSLRSDGLPVAGTGRPAGR
jgi:thiamine biosynthesis lipoprotein ApbE